MVRGTIKWFNSRKGYGFITCDDGSGDVFIHYTAIKSGENEFKIIYEGDIVEFEIVEGQKGPQASNLELVEKGPRQGFQDRRRSY